MEWLLPGAFGVSFVAFFVSTIGLVIWTLVDVVRMPGDASFKAGTQLVWVIVILLAGLVGAIIYLAVGSRPGARPLRGNGSRSGRRRLLLRVGRCSAATLTPFPTDPAARWPNSRSIVSSTATRHVPPA